MRQQHSPQRPKAERGRTAVSIAGEPVPHLPHETDETAENSSAEKPAPEMQQAYADVKRGLVDTDKGAVMDSTYQRVRGKRR